MDKYGHDNRARVKKATKRYFIHFDIYMSHIKFNVFSFLFAVYIQKCEKVCELLPQMYIFFAMAHRQKRKGKVFLLKNT